MYPVQTAPRWGELFLHQFRHVYGGIGKGQRSNGVARAQNGFAAEAVKCGSR